MNLDKLSASIMMEKSNKNFDMTEVTVSNTNNLFMVHTNIVIFLL